MTAPIGRHCQKSSNRARLDSSVYVLRSMTVGTMRVHQRLNAGRAITLCCSANNASSARLTASASPRPLLGTESIDRGTTRLPRKPIAYRNVAKNTA
jgi:hypothetical protein